ncbi:MAG: hypothetical protein ACLP1X_23595 [Polyangiaceae bacterium]
MLIILRTGIVVSVLATFPSLASCITDQSGAPSPQACPADVPEKGSACPLAGAQCSYTPSSNACGVACGCQGGVWDCGPACAILFEDASVGEDANLAPVSTAAEGGDDGG